MKLYKFIVAAFFLSAFTPTASCAQSDGVDIQTQSNAKAKNRVIVNPPGMECNLEDGCLRMQENYVVRDIFRVSNQTDNVTCNGSEVIVKQSRSYGTRTIIGFSLAIFVNGIETDAPEGMVAKLNRPNEPIPMLGFSCFDGAVDIDVIPASEYSRIASSWNPYTIAIPTTD